MCRHDWPPISLNARFAPSYPAHCAGDALVERASAATSGGSGASTLA